MKDKFNQYLNKLFKKTKNIPEAAELKEEIMNDLLEQSDELKKSNMSDDEVYEICINSLGDLYKLIKEYKKDYRKLDKKITLPKYKLGEELINSISHGIGALLAIVALVLLAIKANTGLELLSVLIYTISSFVLYLMSCLYHSLKPNNAKRVFRIIDHCSIFLQIAGTYTPILILKISGALGWTMFGIIWGLAILGIVLNSIDLNKFKKLSMFLYLLMGWCIIFSFKSLWINMEHLGILLGLIGGIIYTIGAILYGIGKKKKYIHSVFHIFCLFAGICFFFTIYFFVI